MTRGPVDFSRSAVSRYIQLATLFRRRIESGDWPFGTQIPTVDTLATEHGVARATVRQALGSLEADGLIERLRAKGTFVTQRPRQKLWCEVPTNWSGLLLAAPGAEIELLDVAHSACPSDLLHHAGTLAPEYRRWRRRHSRNGQRYYLGDAYIDERVAARLPPDALANRTTLRALQDLEDLDLAEVRQTITVGSADVEISDMLEVPLNAPVAYVHRTAVDDGGTVVFVGNGTYRGDVIRLDITVSLQTP
jgi:GntR family transcriptional regulator